MGFNENKTDAMSATGPTESFWKFSFIFGAHSEASNEERQILCDKRRITFLQSHDL